MSGLGALGALLEALRSRKPLVWNGDVLVVFEADVPDSDLWKAQASMVLDADDFVALEKLPTDVRERQRANERLARHAPPARTTFGGGDSYDG